MNRRLKVFLSYSKQDKSAIHNLYKSLKSESWIDPWVDEENLIAGQDFDLEIAKAIRNADAIIVCLSKKSVSREGYVNKEIRNVLEVAKEKAEGAIYVIPLRLTECEPSFEQLKKIHWVDYFTTNGHVKLLKSLSARAKSLGLDVPDQTDDSLITKLIQLVPKLKTPALFFTVGIVGYFLWQGISSLKLVPPTEATTTPAENPMSTPKIDADTKTILGQDGMTLIYVPAGEFSMGSDLKTNEQPIHVVYLDAFWIDQTEVTNEMYAKCASNGKCATYPATLKIITTQFTKTTL